MIEIHCNEEVGGCGVYFEVNEKLVENDSEIQCPFCGIISKNPLKR